MPVHPIAPPLLGRALSAQRWTSLSFLHWPVDPESVRPLFPRGSRPDIVDGVTYVGLVPFVMRGAGPGGRIPVPYFGDFCETNVRLYSVDAQDRHGIVFLTLDATRLATVLLARIGLGLPYAWSKMSATGSAYRSRRRWPNGRVPCPARCLVTLEVGPIAELTELEVWLTARWGLHTRVAGRTIWVPNEHPPWPVHEATVHHLDSDLVQSCGVEVEPSAMLRPLWSSGVKTTFGWPTVVAR
jgi:uncharacterized protein YqjF (DUF2071 family)